MCNTIPVSKFAKGGKMKKVKPVQNYGWGLPFPAKIQVAVESKMRTMDFAFSLLGVK
jgi:hypothetical protein